MAWNDKECNLSEVDHGLVVVSDGLFEWKLLISWDFHTQQSLEFTQNGVKNKTHPLRCSSANRNALLMREVSGEWSDWFKRTGRPQLW